MSSMKLVINPELANICPMYIRLSLVLSKKTICRCFLSAMFYELEFGMIKNTKGFKIESDTPSSVLSKC